MVKLQQFVELSLSRLQMERHTDRHTQANTASFTKVINMQQTRTIYFHRNIHQQHTKCSQQIIYA